MNSHTPPTIQSYTWCSSHLCRSQHIDSPRHPGTACAHCVRSRPYTTLTPPHHSYRLCKLDKTLSWHVAVYGRSSNSIDLRTHKTCPNPPCTPDSKGLGHRRGAGLASHRSRICALTDHRWRCTIRALKQGGRREDQYSILDSRRLGSCGGHGCYYSPGHCLELWYGRQRVAPDLLTGQCFGED